MSFFHICQVTPILLQDNVPAFESSAAVAIIERNLKGKLAEKFETFDVVPIAAASLGQVSAPPMLMFHLCLTEIIYVVRHVSHAMGRG